MLLSDLPPWFVIGTAVSVGLCFGSFLNVVIYRLPRDLNLAYPPSACPGCSAPIAAYDNVPVLGWLLLRGKARCCGTKISMRYPAIEFLGGLLAWVIVEARLMPLSGELGVGGAVATFACYLALGLGLIALAFIDLEFMILPDSLTLGGALLGLLTAAYRPSVGGMSLGDSLDAATAGFAVGWSALSAVGGFLVVWLPFIWLHQKLRGHPGMGLGDAKLLLLAGAWFGPFGVFFALFAGALQGTLAALVLLLVHGKVSEPAQVTAEREELALLIEQAEGEERTALERARDEDPVLSAEADSSFGKAHIAFGPFLSLALLELLVLEAPLRDGFTVWMNGALP